MTEEKTWVKVLAPAKVNLFLRILYRRSDGYHELCTLMQKLSLHDSLSLEKAAEGICLSCSDPVLPENEDNIAYRAAQLFFSSASHLLPEPCGVRIRLTKKIPIAAGLGGGSSDAAAVLLGLNQLYGTGLGRQELAALGAQLGADVPFFVYPYPAAVARGIGERISPAPGCPDALFVLVNPGIAISTRQVYEKFALTSKENIINLQGCVTRNLSEAEPETSLFDPDWLANSLEDITFSMFPELRTIKKELLGSGAQGVLMSGSGPTMFAVFSARQQQEAQHCLRLFRARYPLSFLVRSHQMEGAWT